MNTDQPLARRGRRDGTRAFAHPAWKCIAIFGVVTFAVLFILCVVNLASFTPSPREVHAAEDKTTKEDKNQQQHDNPNVRREQQKYTIISKPHDDDSDQLLANSSTGRALSDLKTCLERSGYHEACRAEHHAYETASARMYERYAGLLLRDEARRMGLVVGDQEQGQDPLEVCVHNDECHVAFEMFMQCIKARMLNPAQDCDAQKQTLSEAVRRAIEQERDGGDEDEEEDGEDWE